MSNVVGRYIICQCTNMIKEKLNSNIGQIDILANMYSDKWHVPLSEAVNAKWFEHWFNWVWLEELQIRFQCHPTKADNWTTLFQPWSFYFVSWSHKEPISKNPRASPLASNFVLTGRKFNHFVATGFFSLTEIEHRLELRVRFLAFNLVPLQVSLSLSFFFLAKSSKSETL